MKERYYKELLIKEGINRAEMEEGLFKYIQGFEILSFSQNSKMKFSTGNYEVGLAVLKGQCSFSIHGKDYENLGKREDVFNGKPTAIYIPIDEKFEIQSQGAAEVALCYSKCEEKTEFEICLPEQVKIMDVGKDNWSREVRIMIGPDSPSVNLILGETINPPGNWSGTPPHKHEQDNPSIESMHEELYYFKCDKENGFGVERFYSPERNINELIYLKENIVTYKPWGYHQIVAGPGYTLYYLFFLSGKGKNLIGYPDPEHEWLNK